MKTELIDDFEERFKKVKQELKFKATLEEIERIFYLKDLILKEDFVSENLSRQICYRITEFYLSWSEYLHSLIMPNPQNLLNLSESKIFNAEEKRDIMEVMKKIMELNSRNILISLTHDRAEEAKFIDDSVSSWKNEVGPKIISFIKKINSEWAKK